MLQVVQAMVCPFIQIGAILLATTTRVYESHACSNCGTQEGAKYGKNIAVRFGLTLGRVSQLRREFEKSWLAFHGDEAEREGMALLTAA